MCTDREIHESHVRTEGSREVRKGKPKPSGQNVKWGGGWGSLFAQCLGNIYHVHGASLTAKTQPMDS